MAIARKGTRRIVIDGTEFRWKIRRKPTYDQGLGQSPLTFVVEHAEEPGALLVASLPYAHPGNWMELPSATVLPSTVVEAVRVALGRGWQPTERGPAFTLPLDERTPVGAH